MRKMMVMLALLCTFIAYGVYNVGDTVNSSDNISWTISGPPGIPTSAKPTIFSIWSDPNSNR